MLNTRIATLLTRMRNMIVRPGRERKENKIESWKKSKYKQTETR